MQIIRNTALAVAVLFGLALTATSAAACGVTQQECERNSIGVVFTGDFAIKAPIEVTVCHGYWSQIDVGTHRGRKTRWWGPVMKYGSWYGDLPISTNECKTYWIRPGTEFRLHASCVDRLITTGVIRKPGTYVMK